MTETRKNLKLLLPVYAIFALIYLVSCLVEPTFFTWTNNVNLFTRITPLVIVGIAQTIVILTGGIDLSIGAILGLTNVIAASLPMVNTPVNIILWLLVPPLVGLLVGTINGFIITKGGFPPLIVTLATSQVLQGISLFILSEPGGKISKAVPAAVTGTLFGIIPIPLIIFLTFTLLFYFILRYTAIGRSVYAVGGNELIAIESGISTAFVKNWVYAISGLLAGFAGIFLTAVMFSGDPLVGNPYTLNSIAVAVIGGTSLAGCVGGILGVIGAAYIYQLLSNILNLLAISTFYQHVVKGIVLIIALTITSAQGKAKLLNMKIKGKEEQPEV